jgi:hypothetical protein
MGADATGISRVRHNTPRSVDGCEATATTSASTATFRVCCGLSKQRSGPGTRGCAVAASASVSRGRGLRLSSDSGLFPAHGSRSGSGGCNHESHQRKSRMVEISLSGSGEGPGWATSRPTLQATFHTASPGLAHSSSRAPRAAARRSAPEPGGARHCTGWTGTAAWERGEPSGVLWDAGLGKGCRGRPGLSSTGRAAAGVKSTGLAGHQS